MSEKRLGKEPGNKRTIIIVNIITNEEIIAYGLNQVKDICGINIAHIYRYLDNNKIYKNQWQFKSNII